MGLAHYAEKVGDTQQVVIMSLEYILKRLQIYKITKKDLITENTREQTIW